MKKKIVSTPGIWYLIGVLFLLLFLIVWIIASLFQENIFVIISDVSKNSFFAIAGSLAVSFLIDVGNTSRENIIKKNAFLQLKNNIEAIYSNIAGISFVLKQCIDYDKDGRVLLKNYYNKEFYYRSGNVIMFTTLDEISSFKGKIERFVSKIIYSNSFVNLDNKLGEALESLSVENFYFINDLREKIIEHGVILSNLKNDIDLLEKIVNILGDFLGKKDNFEMLSEEDAMKYHDERIKFGKQHSHELEFINKIIKK